ncbi:serine/threonine-protein kinase UCN [Brachypodium distachyon]|uniref:non-specific serine/threonine protein kinase n=1 Tax=Brachypodium distachyon TaxID=15368 RepID=A0A0Q3FL22_BRADI|nr:serine/threonine-protein kinase UCN [Brachypodium distachyon]KQJ98900.1 hypothetical protein BRADI_3g39860v3 [Brachypodium distachyon]|eukprot:XP_003574739.1 serine/threonine-protein kinase UCN [Brachypodium distachyon]
MDVDLDRVRALRVLGRGAMGTVFLVSDAGSGTRYALKVFDKRSGKPGADRRAHWEVSLLSRLAQNPAAHLPSLLGSAETPDLLAWAVPYCPGGDLNELRYALPDRVFSPAAIRFYVAEVVSALADLHAAGVVYRDLKPENVLLRADGHVTLTDFDLSRFLPTSPSSSPPPPSSSRPPVFARRRRHAEKREQPPLPSAAPSTTPKQQFQTLVRFLMRSGNGAGGAMDNLLGKKAKSARVSPAVKPAACSGRSYSFVGTEEYVAPEMIRGEGHGLAVDWWAVGILIHEMAYGRSPFKGRNRKETFRNVLHMDLEFPGDARRRTPELADLVSRLLERDPARRLGFGGGADEVRAHPFFSGVDWEMLAEVSRPPYIPPPADHQDEAAAGGEGFDVRDYFTKLHQPTPPESGRNSSDFSSEF